MALEFLLGFGGDSFLTQVRAGEYYGFVTMLLLGAGLMFEVPVAMLALARIGVASADFYRR
ncbi:MAG: twin-arginine translocase subunit TatC, partial [Thermoleophilia bacterium]|nr:twin-arginine translocase subunit TatC [Thermoleophilia bacterium]